MCKSRSERFTKSIRREWEEKESGGDQRRQAVNEAKESSEHTYTRKLRECVVRVLNNECFLCFRVLGRKKTRKIRGKKERNKKKEMYYCLSTCSIFSTLISRSHGHFTTDTREILDEREEASIWRGRKEEKERAISISICNLITSHCLLFFVFFSSLIPL